MLIMKIKFPKMIYYMRLTKKKWQKYGKSICKIKFETSLNICKYNIYILLYYNHYEYYANVKNPDSTDI